MQGDVLSKREQFAVSLRKKKKQLLLGQKRLKIGAKSQVYYELCSYFTDHLDLVTMKAQY
jgi:hypothetical protein